MLIGNRIRTIRKSNNMTIKDLAEKIGVTSGYISQIERDLIDPSLSVLKRICKALNTPLSILFTEETLPEVVVSAANERKKIRFDDQSSTYEFLTPYIKDQDFVSQLEVFKFTIDPNSSVSESEQRHRSEECHYVLSGEVEYEIGEELYKVSAGGSIYIPENTPHKIHNKSTEKAEGIAVLAM